jgi:dTDP-glucose 4,6-dehydratase
MFHQKLKKGEAFNFAYENPLSVREIGRKILTQMGKADLEFNIQGLAPHEIPYQALSSKKAREQLGWKPRHGLETGIKQTVSFLKNAAK